MKSSEFMMCPRALTSPISVTESCVCWRGCLGEVRLFQKSARQWVKGFMPIFKVYNDLGDLLYSVNKSASAMLICSSGSKHAIDLEFMINSINLKQIWIRLMPLLMVL